MPIYYFPDYFVELVIDKRIKSSITQLEIPTFPPQVGVSDRFGTLPVKDLPRERYARILDKTLL